MKITKTGRLISLAFGIIVFGFFAFLYPFHLNYQEQYQLFMFSADYFLSFMGKPGGFSDYIGHFFTQFFFYSWVGAIIVACLLTLLQRMVLFISRQLKAKPLWMPLTFIPSLLYWSLLCNENYLYGGLIAMLLVTSFIATFMFFHTVTSRVSFVLISIPVLYWLVGGAFLMLPLFAITRELMFAKIKKFRLALFAVGCIIISLALPIFSKKFFLQYPMIRVWVGTDFFRFPVNIPLSVGITGILIVFIPFALHILTAHLKSGRQTLLLVAQLVVLVPAGILFIDQSVDMAKEEVMAYDFNVRMRKWDRVIAMADKKTPSSPLSVTCLNLALAKKGLLADRMFSYYQNGIQGLLPDFTRDFTIPEITGEVYYQLGFINTAQRYTFEAMEALPDYQKSVRSVKRLAETNLINGDYTVAGKYLYLLQKTFYYRSWAIKVRQSIKDETLIDRHPEWGWLRKCRVKEDFLFSEGEKEMMLGVLFSHNKENRMAFEYLMACCLLKKDLPHFMKYFPLSESLHYRTLPKSYQEALIYIWGLNHNDPAKSIPYPISAQVKKRVEQYQNIYTSRFDAEPLLRNQFKDTYWYYLHFRK